MLRKLEILNKNWYYIYNSNNGGMFMSNFDISKFVNPPKSARPMARWWWPGLDVDKEELLREVADMDEMNLAGGEIQALLTAYLPK